MSSSQVLFSVDIACVALNAVLAARVLAARPRLLSAQLIALIACNSICSILLSRYEYGYWIPQPYQFDVSSFATVLNFARNLTPGLFMLLCFKVFVDRPRFPRWLLALFFAEMILDVPMRGALQGSVGDVFTRIVPAVLQALFAGFAVYWTIANWRADLIERRRWARVLTIVIIGLNIIGATLFLRVLIPQNSVENYYAHLALAASNLPIVLFVLLFLRDEDLVTSMDTRPVQAQSTGTASPPSAEIAAILGRLSQLMEAECVYRRPSLSLKELADLAGVPEYRLRKIIHEQLGYPNFNVFLHHFRIREACQQLRDPKMRRIPILTIALSTGYQSINTFNRGFREILDMTPSAYRSLDEAEIPAAPKKISPQTT
ncbi:MAG TPA: helix-turn-helix transcriptional regulator [Steroidobacteraceae bacterium]|jgi:AraC-like DNA-binding protein